MNFEELTEIASCFTVSSKRKTIFSSDEPVLNDLLSIPSQTKKFRYPAPVVVSKPTNTNVLKNDVCINAVRKETSMFSSNLPSGSSSVFTAEQKIVSDKHSLAVSSSTACHFGDFNQTLKTAPKTACRQVTGFTTGSGKNVDVSDTALNQARCLFNEDSESMPDSRGFAEPKSFSGFSTGAGSTISVSKKSLSFAKKLFSNETSMNSALNSVSDDSKHESMRESGSGGETQSFCGFSTGGGSKINVSEKALSFAKKLFADETCLDVSDAANQTGSGFSFNGDPKVASMFAPSGAPESQSFSGFSNGASSTINVSEKALSFAKKLFADEASCDPKTFKVTDTSEASSTVKFSGFSTVGGAHINVSAKSVAFAKRLFADECDSDMSEAEPDETVTLSPRIIPRQAFGTCSSTSHEDMHCKQDTSSNVATVPTGFSTANVKHVSVCAKVLEKARTFFSDLVDSECLNESDDSSELDSCSQGLIDAAESCHNTLLHKSGSGPICINKVPPSASHCSPLLAGEDITVLSVSGENHNRVDGFLYSLKKDRKKLSMFCVLRGSRPQTYDEEDLISSFGMFPQVLEIKSTNAEFFKFTKEHIYATDRDRINSDEFALVGDGVCIKLDREVLTADEIFKCFLHCSGVDKSLVTREWFCNHYRWIVWKFAAMEVSFPHLFAKKRLSLHNVLLQLKYRYDREIEHNERSALKLIYEKDESPSKPIVLCLSGSLKQAQKGASVIELTDGWYSINAVLDEVLVVRLRSSTVGDKLFILNARLDGNEEGCHPLQAPPNVRLVLHANSVRRAAWWSRLGFIYPKQLPLFPLVSLRPECGLVPQISVVIIRVYPIQFMERFKDGRTVFRNERTEEIEKLNFDRKREKCYENVLQKVEDEFERQHNKENRAAKVHYEKKVDIQKAQTGHEIHSLLVASSDPNAVHEVLNPEQRQALEKYQCEVRDRRIAQLQDEFQQALLNADSSELPEERRVSPLIKLRVSSLHKCDGIHKKESILTVWHPTEDQLSLLKEGRLVSVTNVSVSGSSGGMSLGTTRTSVIMESSADRVLVDSLYQQRNLVMLGDVKDLINFCRNNTSLQTESHTELDVVGFVVDISTCSKFDTVYVCDHEQNNVAIRFFGGLKAHSLERTIIPAACLGFANLRIYVTSDCRESPINGRIPYLNAHELVSVYTNPQQEHLKQEFQFLHHFILSRPGFLAESRRTLSDVRCGRISSSIQTNYTTRMCDQSPYHQQITPKGQPSEAKDIHTSGGSDSGRTPVRPDQKQRLAERKLLYFQQFPSVPVANVHLKSSNASSQGFKPPELIDNKP